MVKNDSKYWERRKADLIYRQMDKAEAKADDIDKIYNEAQRYLNKQADKVFDKFQRDYGLSETDARQVLKDMKGKRNLSEMRKVLEARPDDPNINQLLADMDSGAYAFRLNRFNELSQQVDRLRNAMYQAEKKQSDRFYPDLMKDSYNRATFNLQQHTGLAYHFNALPEAEIKRLSHLKWSGNNYSGRIWNNTGELARQLKNEFLVSLMTGRSNRDVINIISERFNAGRNNARRLVRTESAFFHNEMEALSYEEADIEYYRFIAVLDKRTSAICREHDGKVYKVSERKTGINYPPLHPWCRSTTIAHDEDVDYSKLKRRARNPKTNKVEYVPADMTYKEWYDKYVDGEEVVEGSKPEVDDSIFIADKPNEIDDFFKKQKSYQKWYNGLTDDERSVIYSYTTENYHNFNNIKRYGLDEALKIREKFWFENDGDIEDLPFALDIVKDTELNIPILEKAISKFAPEKSFKAYRGSGSISALGQDLGYLDFEVGQSIKLDKTFTSFSLDRNYAKEFAFDGDGANVLFEVTVKKGQKTGAYIAELADFSPEKEYLMKPNLKYNVISKTESKDGLLVYGLEVLENGS
ncbi:minor capsid protein [Streptococcus anginosus]|uniref:minor capsid protein n=1 Tax=Streptococcus anginosus TaxID=1328 RepID=UPI0022E6F14D|nr:minor capsid protein [Streptococcus anginosus]